MSRPRLYTDEEYKVRRRALDAARHAAQREQTLARKAERYRTDPSYRAKIIQQAKRWREANRERSDEIGRASWARKRQRQASV